MYRERAIDERIESDLTAITKRVLDYLGESRVTAILLVGGFGRGEGSVSRREGHVRVINDYDMIVVPAARTMIGYSVFLHRFGSGLEQIAGQLAHELGVRQIDLTSKPHRFFTAPDPWTIDRYEIREGHFVLFGRRDLCRQLSGREAADIPLLEGTRLLRNRGAGLLLGALYLQRNGGGLTKEGVENVLIECNKMFLAMGDCVLLRYRRYDVSYDERLRRATTLLPGLEGIELTVVQQYLDALSFKLRPDTTPISEDIGNHWLTTRGLFEDFVPWFESQRLLEATSDPSDHRFLGDGRSWRRVMQAAFRRPAAMATVKGRAELRLKSDLLLSLRLVCYLVSAFRREHDRAAELRTAAGLLACDLVGEPPTWWMECVRTLLSIWHPGGAVGQALRSFT